MDPSHPPVNTAGDPSISTVGAGAASSQCTPTPLSLLRCRSASTGSGPEAGLGLDTVAAPWIDQVEFRTACGSKRCPGVPVVGLPIARGALQTQAGGRPPSPPTVTPPSAGSALSSASVASHAFTSAMQDRLRTPYVAWLSEAHGRAIRDGWGCCETQNTRGHKQVRNSLTVPARPPPGGAIVANLRLVCTRASWPDLWQLGRCRVCGSAATQLQRRCLQLRWRQLCQPHTDGAFPTAAQAAGSSTRP